MVNESHRLDGDNISLYKIDWSDYDQTLIQQRSDDIHVSPVYDGDDVYVFVKEAKNDHDEGTIYGTLPVPFEEVQAVHARAYGDVDDEDITLLGAEDVGTDELPEDLYNELLDTVDGRGFDVESLAEVYQAPALVDVEEYRPVVT